jgi:hypothetical protein
MTKFSRSSNIRQEGLGCRRLILEVLPGPEGLARGGIS